ncbi:MAG: NUDIX hydrolase [Alphaproteobacteria bacterium]
MRYSFTPPPEALNSRVPVVISTEPLVAAMHRTTAIGMILCDKRILLGRAVSGGSKKSFHTYPGGRVDAGENHFTALQREFVEETGILEPISFMVREGEIVSQDLYVYPLQKDGKRELIQRRYLMASTAYRGTYPGSNELANIRAVTLSELKEHVQNQYYRHFKSLPHTAVPLGRLNMLQTDAMATYMMLPIFKEMGLENGK